MNKKFLLTTILLPFTMVSLLLGGQVEAKIPVAHYTDADKCYVHTSLDETVKAVAATQPPRDHVELVWVDGHAVQRAQRAKGLRNFSAESIFNGNFFSQELFEKVSSRANPLSVWENLDQNVVTPYKNLMGHDGKKGASGKSPATKEGSSTGTLRTQKDITDFSSKASSGMINSLVGLINPFELMDQG